MTPERRHHLVVALVAAVAGAAFALEFARAGIIPSPSLAFWLGVVGIVALVMVLLSAPAQQTAPLATPARAGWAEFRRELRRSRRSGRPLTLLRAPGPLGIDGASSDDPEARARQLHGYLRLVDRTWVDDGSVYLLLPETSRSAADTLVTRLQTLTPESLPADVRLATFPDDGLTSGALISAVHGAELSEVPTPIRAAATGDEPIADDEATEVDKALAERAAK